METIPNRIQLSGDQIQKLFAFVRSKYVRYVDLQYELVDHLASNIESQINADPNISFDEALKESYKEFPVTGFSSFVASQEKALNRYWGRKYWTFLRSCFTLPKAIATTGLFIFCYLSISSFGGVGMIVPMLCIVGLSLFTFYQLYILRESIETGEYLFASTFSSRLMGFGYLPFCLYNLVQMVAEDSTIIKSFNPIILSVILTLGTIMTHASATEMPKMFRDEINSKYGHLGLKISL